MALANLALRFLLELGGLAAAAYAAHELVGHSDPTRWLAAVGAGVTVVVFWSLVVAPKAANGLSQPHRDLIGTVVLLLAAVALGLAGQLPVAIGFGLLIVANAVLLIVLGDAADRFARPAS
jgi:hypothetical protein